MNASHKMIPGICALMFFLVFSTGNIAQDARFEWASAINTSLYDVEYHIDVDAAGNIYLAGNFDSVIDVNPGAASFNLTAAGDEDIFIVKLNPKGEFLWAKRIGGGDKDYMKAIKVDPAGNLYGTGYFWGTADFDPDTATANLSSNGNGPDAFVIKLMPSGKLTWVKQFEAQIGALPQAIAIDDSNNVYTGGHYYGTVDFNPGNGKSELSSNYTYEDLFICKLDANGLFQWVKKQGGMYAENMAAMALDDLGNIYTTGHFNGTVDFDTGPGTINLSSLANDAFICKLDRNGNTLWAKNFWSPSDDRGVDIALDQLGGVYTTGTFEGYPDFDPGPGNHSIATNGDKDVYIHKLTTNGDFVWCKTLGSGDNDLAYALATDDFGNVYTTGGFSGTWQFDTTSSGLSSYFNDGYLYKLDSAGYFQWVKHLYGNGGCRGLDLQIDDSLNILSTGFFSNTIDFDPGSSTANLSTSSSVTQNMYVHKMACYCDSCKSSNVCPNTVGIINPIKKRLVEVYPNPSAGNFKIDLGETHSTVEMKLYDRTGQLVYQHKSNDIQIINTEVSLPPGIYMVFLRTGHRYNSSFEIVIE